LTKCLGRHKSHFSLNWQVAIFFRAYSVLRSVQLHALSKEGRLGFLDSRLTFSVLCSSIARSRP